MMDTSENYRNISIHVTWHVIWKTLPCNLACEQALDGMDSVIMNKWEIKNKWKTRLTWTKGMFTGYL